MRCILNSIFDDAMDIILWTMHFLRAQGLRIKKSIVYQDNQSTILLAKNGKRSSGKRTRYLDCHNPSNNQAITQKSFLLSLLLHSTVQELILKDSSPVSFLKEEL